MHSSVAVRRLSGASIAELADDLAGSSRCRARPAYSARSRCRTSRRRARLWRTDVALPEMTLGHERLEPVHRSVAADRIAHVPDQDDHLIEPPAVERQRERLQRQRNPRMRSREEVIRKQFAMMARMRNGTMVLVEAVATMNSDAPLVKSSVQCIDYPPRRARPRRNLLVIPMTALDCCLQSYPLYRASSLASLRRRWSVRRLSSYECDPGFSPSIELMTLQLNETHDPARRSFVESANAPDSDFPIQNLPFGVFRPAAGCRRASASRSATRSSTSRRRLVLRGDGGRRSGEGLRRAAPQSSHVARRRRPGRRCGWRCRAA